MKKGIHPNWHHDCVVTCSCGNSFVIGSTTDTLTVDICSACHPFFTGEVRFVDRQGRVDRFKKKMQAAQDVQAAKKATKKTATAKQAAAAQSYQDVLREQRAQLRKTQSTATASAS